MKASPENPIYSVAIVDGETKYDVTPALCNLDLSDQDGQLAQSATLGLMNVQVSGKWLSTIVGIRQRVFIYADDGKKKDEVFRGVIWTDYYKSDLSTRDMSLKCYDNLIYFQESEDAEFFPEGKTTEDVVSTLCQKWGVPLKYAYESITHSKLALRGALSDILTSDVLDLVKTKTGKKYILRSTKDTIEVVKTGQNQTVYDISSKNNAVSTRTERTMDGLVTKVVILGKAGNDERQPVEATVEGNVAEYGTLQKIHDRKENTSLADAQKEAQAIIDEKGKPKTVYEVKCSDIPWIRKGDRVHVNAGAISDQDLIVLSIDRSISNKSKEMTLTCERVESA